jgi:hypothetical protein
MTPYSTTMELSELCYNVSASVTLWQTTMLYHVSDDMHKLPIWHEDMKLP